MPGSENQFKTEVGDTVYYLVDQSTLTPEGKETLRRQAAWLKQYSDVTVQVEGHADERGTREYNISLSARRATTTREFLIAQGIEASRISSIAYGKERPAALCDAEQCWSQNRRTVTVITGVRRTTQLNGRHSLRAIQAATPAVQISRTAKPHCLGRPEGILTLKAH